MKKMLALALLAATVVLSGCCGLPCSGTRLAAGLGNRVIGSGHLATREVSVSDFTGVEAGSAFVLDVVQSDSFGVSVTADDNVIDYVDVSKVGSALRLSLKPGRSYSNVTLRAKVSMPSLKALQLSGACRATVTGFSSSSDLTLDLSGASTLRGDLQAGDTRMTASGASSATLTGSAGSLRLDGSGGSRLSLANFPVSGANVRLSGASSATLTVNGRLDADLSGASRLEYGGNTTLGRTTTSGGSSLNRR